jgi:hypothetical protein
MILIMRVGPSINNLINMRSRVEVKKQETGVKTQQAVTGLQASKKLAEALGQITL